ncbi:RluA family pseudouridine synthase [bacterium]|nr:RluA family pseudouridine synthase [bacterium]
MSDPPELHRPYRLITAPGQHRLRIDRYLQQALPSISRHKVHELIDAGLVRVDGNVPKKSYKIGPGEHVEIFFRDQPPSDIRPEAIPLDIHFEDDYLLVVNKPQGMVTHPAHGHFSGTLVNALLHYLGMGSAGRTIRPGIVHRLDKGTSGLLVIAKNEQVHRKLTDQFAAREVHRVYNAIIWGHFRDPEGTIDAPLGRHPGDRKRFAVVRRGGKVAITTYRVEAIYRDTSLLSLQLKTGRTHQIRAHLEHLGHPVFGDVTYGGRHKRLRGFPGAQKKLYFDLLETLPDLALHAATLGFRHPVTGEELSFVAPRPANFERILELLLDNAGARLDNV